MIRLVRGWRTQALEGGLRAYEARLSFWRSAPDGGQSAAINRGVAYGFYGASIEQQLARIETELVAIRAMLSQRTSTNTP